MCRLEIKKMHFVVWKKKSKEKRKELVKMIKNAARKHPGGPLRKQDSFKLQNLRPAGKLGMTLTYWCKKKKTPDKHKKKKKMHTQNNQYA